MVVGRRRQISPAQGCRRRSIQGSSSAIAAPHIPRRGFPVDCVCPPTHQPQQRNLKNFRINLPDVVGKHSYEGQLCVTVDLGLEVEPAEREPGIMCHTQVDGSAVKAEKHENSPALTALRANVRRWINTNKVTQRELADRIGTHQATITNIMARRNISVVIVERIAAVTGYRSCGGLLLDRTMFRAELADQARWLADLTCEEIDLEIAKLEQLRLLKVNKY